MTDGTAFSDGPNGTTIRQVATAGDYATVDVSFGCAAAPPTVALSPASILGVPGHVAGLTVTVSNQDSANCPATTFRLSAGGSAPGSVSPAVHTLSPGQTATLTVTSPTNDGSYTLQVGAADSDGLPPAHPTAGQGSAALIVDGTPPSTPVGLAGESDRKGAITLTWQVASDELSGIAGYYAVIAALMERELAGNSPRRKRHFPPQSCHNAAVHPGSSRF